MNIRQPTNLLPTRRRLSSPCPQSPRRRSVSKTRVVKIAATQQPKSTQRRHYPDRIALDLIICRLQSRYQQNLDYFCQQSAEIADELQQETRSYGLGRTVYLTVAVTAKTFADDKRGPTPCVSRHLRLEDPPTSGNPSHTVAAPYPR